MRNNLKVPFPEKDEAKQLGARWDAARKLWYVQNVEDLSPFAKWSPTPHDAAPAVAPKKSAPAKVHQTADLFDAGVKDIQSPRLCACPPWEVCDNCASTALKHSTP